MWAIYLHGLAQWKQAISAQLSILLIILGIFIFSKLIHRLWNGILTYNQVLWKLFRFSSGIYTAFYTHTKWYAFILLRLKDSKNQFFILGNRHIRAELHMCRGSCGVGYPSLSHLYAKLGEIAFVNDIHFSFQIVPKWLWKRFDKRNVSYGHT